MFYRYADLVEKPLDASEAQGLQGTYQEIELAKQLGLIFELKVMYLSSR